MTIDTETIQGRINAIAFMRRSGVRVLEVRRGYGRAVMPLAGNENHINSMYIAAFSVLAEAGAVIPGSSFLDAEKYYPVVKKMDLDFLKPAFSDVFAAHELAGPQIEALEADLQAMGKAEYIADLSLVDEGGQVVAKAAVTVKLLSHR
jgi:hypothetical protein